MPTTENDDDEHNDTTHHFQQPPQHDATHHLQPQLPNDAAHHLPSPHQTGTIATRRHDTTPNTTAADDVKTMRQREAPPAMTQRAVHTTPATTTTRTTTTLQAKKPTQIYATIPLLDDWGGTTYDEDTYPGGLADDEQHKELAHRYSFIPEEYYTKTGRQVVTPSCLQLYLDRHPDPTPCDCQEICSGSGRLSRVAESTGLVVRSPVDRRYSWCPDRPGHRQLLQTARDHFRPRTTHWAPDCRY